MHCLSSRVTLKRKKPRISFLNNCLPSLIFLLKCPSEHILVNRWCEFNCRIIISAVSLLLLFSSPFTIIFKIKFRNLKWLRSILTFCWLLLCFRFAARLLAWILSHVMGASVGFRVGGWKCLRDVAVKFKKVFLPCHLLNLLCLYIKHFSWGRQMGVFLLFHVVSS